MKALIFATIPTRLHEKVFGRPFIIKPMKRTESASETYIFSSGEFLASLWTQLDRYPTILARRNSPDNITFELTQKVVNHLEKQQHINGSCSFGGITQSKSLLIILDRGMDLSTLWLHDLAFQVDSFFESLS